MAKQEKSLKRLQKRIEKARRIEKKAIKAREKKHRQEELAHAKGQEKRRKWYKSYEAEAKKAAKVIWKWYEEFLASSIFQEIVDSKNETHFSKLKISEGISCHVPTGWGGKWERNQWLTIDMYDKKLFVHTAAKYGKAASIEEMKDLLKWVEPPIIIAFAKTIKSGAIWDIINIS